MKNVVIKVYRAANERLKTRAGEPKYRFNGIERNEDFNLNWDLADFRSYDPVIGRYLQGDPIVKYKESSYASFAGNPINFIDPLGADTLKQIGKDLFYGGYLDGPTVTAKASSQNSSKSNSRSLIDEIFVNRFRHWEPMGTGAGLSVNPNFPQYSQYAEDIKQISWNMLSPVLLGVAGGGVYSNVGTGTQIIQKAKDLQTYFRYWRAFKSISTSNRSLSIVNSFEYRIVSTSMSPVLRAPKGGIMFGERFYAGGQFLPGSHTVLSGIRTTGNPIPLSTPLGGYNSLRPSPIFYPPLSNAQRWAIGIGGTGVGLSYGFLQMQKDINK